MKNSKKLILSIIGGGIASWLFGTVFLPLIITEEESFVISGFETLLVLGVMVGVAMILLVLLNYFNE